MISVNSGDGGIGGEGGSAITGGDVGGCAGGGDVGSGGGDGDAAIAADSPQRDLCRAQHNNSLLM